MKFITTIGPFIQFNVKEGRTLNFYAHGIESLQYPYGWLWLATYGFRWGDNYRVLREVDVGKVGY
jgi:hypothetical protein